MTIYAIYATFTLGHYFIACIMEITKKQQEVLAFMKEFFAEKGEMPTLREIQESLGYSTTSSVQRHTEALKKKGYLSVEKHQSRGLRIKRAESRKYPIPLVGSVSCGQPILAEENIEAYIPYEIKGDPKDYFFLHAIGDSMNKADINDGDIVLIKMQQNADAGEKVVALIGDEATIKIFKNEGNRIVLEPRSTNKIHKPIYVYNPEEFQIQGKVVGKIKK
ncbi:MAG: LexA repressor [uncultured bacterium]|nr:MAG: LexA repressor [uncultured bacterium]